MARKSSIVLLIGAAIPVAVDAQLLRPPTGLDIAGFKDYKGLQKGIRSSCFRDC